MPFRGPASSIPIWQERAACFLAQHGRSFSIRDVGRRGGLELQDQRLPFDEWTEIFGSERLTGALLDRITHHVHILEMNADSYRLKQSRRKRA